MAAEHRAAVVPTIKPAPVIAVFAEVVVAPIILGTGDPLGGPWTKAAPVNPKKLGAAEADPQPSTAQRTTSTLFILLSRRRVDLVGQTRTSRRSGLRRCHRVCAGVERRDQGCPSIRELDDMVLNL